MAFGTDQLDKETLDRERILQSYFSWYYPSTMSIVISVTIMVYIQDHMGWNFGFGVLAVIIYVLLCFHVLIWFFTLCQSEAKL